MSEERQAQDAHGIVPPADPERLERLALLTLIEGNEPALKLIVTWPRVKAGDKKKEAAIARWSQLSGVRPGIVEALWDLLRRNEFCRANGTVDEDAMRYARRVLAQKIGGV